VPSGSPGATNVCYLLPGLYTYSSSITLTQHYVSFISQIKWAACITNLDAAGHPFYFSAPAHDLTFDGIQLANNRYDFQLGDQGNVGAVSNNAARNLWCHGTGNNWAGAPNASGIEVVCGSGALVENCLLEWNGTNYIGSNHGIYAGGTNGIYRNNVCRFNGGAGIIVNGHLDTGGVRDDGNSITGNLCYSNLSLGAQISIKCDAAGNAGTNSVIGNTVQDGANNYAIFCASGAVLLLTNNIILSTGSGVDNLGTVWANYNMATATLAAPGGSDVITNYTGLNSDYTLKADSPARGRGLNGVDIGAYSYGAVVNTPRAVRILSH
jgi:hypothetical protein